jgi:hypothetical protein
LELLLEREVDDEAGGLRFVDEEVLRRDDPLLRLTPLLDRLLVRLLIPLLLFDPPPIDPLFFDMIYSSIV